MSLVFSSLFCDPSVVAVEIRHDAHERRQVVRAQLADVEKEGVPLDAEGIGDSHAASLLDLRIQIGDAAP